MNRPATEIRRPLRLLGLLKTPGGHVARPPTRSPRCSPGSVPTTPTTRPSFCASPTRRRVLELMPAPQRSHGDRPCWDSNPHSAGRLMNLDIVSCETWASAAARPPRVRAAGRRGLSDRTLQSNIADAVATLMDSNPILVTPDADLIDAAVLIADYNLHTISVVDDEGQALGVVTVDAVLRPPFPTTGASERPGHAWFAKT